MKKTFLFSVLICFSSILFASYGKISGGIYTSPDKSFSVKIPQKTLSIDDEIEPYIYFELDDESRHFEYDDLRRAPWGIIVGSLPSGDIVNTLGAYLQSIPHSFATVLTGARHILEKKFIQVAGRRALQVVLVDDSIYAYRAYFFKQYPLTIPTYHVITIIDGSSKTLVVHYWRSQKKIPKRLNDSNNAIVTSFLNSLQISNSKEVSSHDTDEGANNFSPYMGKYYHSKSPLILVHLRKPDPRNDISYVLITMKDGSTLSKQKQIELFKEKYAKNYFSSFNEPIVDVIPKKTLFHIKRLYVGYEYSEIRVVLDSGPYKGLTALMTQPNDYIPQYIMR